VLLGALLCTPEVMKLNFWLRSDEEVEQGVREMGIRFWRKSPARGLTVRQRLELVEMETDEKADTAVLSMGLDCAASVGLRTPPAPETGSAEAGVGVSRVLV
jgi:hypothetical protein